MTTLAEHIIVAGVENRPLILEKSMYDSWASRICLFIKGKKNGRMMLDSIDEGPLVYPMVVGEDGQTRPKKYSEHTEAQQLQDDCDVQATNIILHGLPPAVLYNLFDNFASVQVQVNTMFLNALPPEWSKFVTDVKLAKSLYTTNYDQLYAYLSQHERHSNEVRIMRERYLDPLELVSNSQTLYNPSQSPQHLGSSMYPPPQQFIPVYAAPIHHQHHHTLVNPQQQSVSLQPFISPSVTQQSQAKFPQLDSGLDVPTFQQGEDPIDCINKAMEFLFVMVSRNRGIAITLRGNYAAGQAKVVKCYNCLGEGHMAKQCTQPKRPRISAWFKEKLMLVEAKEAGQILDEEQLAFIPELGIVEVQLAQQTILQNLAFYTEDLHAYDSDCDDISSAKADVQEMSYSEQTYIVDFPDNEITSDSNIIPYSQYLQESQDAANLDKENQTNKMVNESLTAELERYKEREHDVILMIDDEETLILEEDKQAFWLKHSNYNPNTSVKSHTPVRTESPSKFLRTTSNAIMADECNKCLELEIELLKKKDLIEKDVFVMEKKDGLNMKVGIATRVNLEESGAKCDVSPKLCNSSHLVSPTTTINMPRGLYNIDVAPTFRVPLTTIDALGVICNSIKVDNTNADVIPCKAVDINTMSTSYARAAGVSAKDQPKVNSNFRPLVDDPIFDGVNIFIPYKVVKKAGLEAILEGGPWLIRKLHDVRIQVFEEDGISLIATFIGKPVTLYSYTSSMCNDSWGRSSFAQCLIKVNSEADLVDIATIDIPLLTGDDFTKETIRVKYEWRPPRCDLCKIFGHVHDHCPNKVVCPPIVTTSNVVTPTIEKTNNGFQTMSKKKKRKSKSKLQMVVSLPVHRLNKRLDMSQM
ncbi:copia protein [Tanacetum coccineum]